MLLFTPGKNDDGADTYIASENDIPCGKCSFKSNGYEMCFVSLECGDDIIAEGLIRSAMNFCANNGCYIVRIEKDMLAPAFERVGFSAVRTEVEIPEALASSCCSCKNNLE